MDTGGLMGHNLTENGQKTYRSFGFFLGDYIVGTHFWHFWLKAVVKVNQVMIGRLVLHDGLGG